MRVLYVITGLGIGGAETQLSAVAQRLAKNHGIGVCYLTGEQKILKGASDIQVLPLEMDRSLSGFFRGYLKLRKMIVDFKPDVVHAHMFHANIICRLLRLTVRIPRLICTAHNTCEGGRLRMLTYRLTDALADLTTNVSHEAVLAFEKKGAVPEGTMKVVANGIDVDVFKLNDQIRKSVRHTVCLKDNERIILAVGRLAEAKDYPNLLAAFANVRESHKDLKLWIVGEGPEKAALLKLVEHFKITECVAFWGARADVSILYNAADVYVLSSAWEGFGLVVAEAMATERVVVATDCGGVREVLGEDGFLVIPRDVNALSQGIENALGLSAEQQLEMGARARARVIERFSLDSTVAKWLTIYGVSTGSDSRA